MRSVRWWIPLLVLVMLGSLVAGAKDTADVDTTEEGEEYEDVTEVTTEVEGTTRDFLEDLQPLLKEIQRRVYPAVSELLADPDLSNECTGSLIALLRGVQNQKKWALMIATASGGLPQNLLLGAQGSFGSYDQCLEAERIDDDGLVTLRGQYCTLYITPNKKMFDGLREQLKDDPFLKETVLKLKVWPKDVLGVPSGLKIGLCTPDKCSSEDLNHILNKLINKVYGTEFEIGNCRIKGEKVPTTFQRCVFALGYLLLVLVIIGTSTDYYLNRVRDKPIYISPWFAITFVLMFSARRNVLRLFTPYTPQTKELGFLNGIKVLLSCWVVYGHSAIFISPDVYIHLSGYVLLLQKLSFQIIANSFMAVSSFYFLSGFLLGYLCLKEKKRIIKQNPAVLITIMFIRRYFRLVVPLLVVVCFSMLMPLWADSPNDKRSLFEVYSRRCPQNWWTIPTLYSNFIGVDGMCLGHSWYVATDMQVFLVASILTMVIVSQPRIGLILTSVLTFASCVWIAARTYAYGYAPIIGFTGAHYKVILDTFDYIYAQPITHSGCYFLGIICAYACFHGKRFQWYIQTLLWVLAHACASYVVFITVNWYRHGLPGPLGQSLYAGFHRLTFTFGLFWLIYACVHGMAPTIRRILEHSAFRALGRLAFGVYLVHFAVVYMQQGLMKSQAFHPNQYLLLQTTLGILGISFGLAFLMNIAVESPIAHLDNFIFKKLMGKIIGEPQTHKEAEMIGRKAEVALTLEQHYDHWRRTSSKKSVRSDPSLDAVAVETGRNGTLAKVVDNKPPTDVTSDVSNNNSAGMKKSNRAQDDGRQRVNGANPINSLPDKTKL